MGEQPMKKLSVVLLVVCSVAFAGFAEAAKPKKRTRNANRIGAYGIGFIGQSKYTGDQTNAEDFAVIRLQDLGESSQNISVATEDTDIGYNATFGYRLNSASRKSARWSPRLAAKWTSTTAVASATPP
jgi:hypothetical protein